MEPRWRKNVFGAKSSRLRKLKILQTSIIMMIVILVLSVFILGIVAIRRGTDTIGDRAFNEEPESEISVSNVFTKTDFPYPIKFDEVTIGHVVIGKDKDGTVWGWGGRDEYSLGLQYGDHNYVPMKIDYGRTFKTIKTHEHATVAIDTDGNIWYWGGISTSSQKTPQQISSGTTFIDVDLAQDVIIALDNQHRIWTRGSNTWGQLGNGTTGTTQSTFQRITSTGSTKFNLVETDGYFCMAVDTSGYVWTWGSNSRKQLGNGGTGNSTVGETKVQTVPAKLTSIQAKKIVSGASGAVILDKSGLIWRWGAINDNSSQDISTPQKVSDKKFTDIVGWSHCLALDSDGNVYTFGSNSSGCLGTGDTNTNTILSNPTLINFNGVKISKIYADNGISGAIDVNGDLWLWGNGYYGQLGNGTYGSSKFQYTPLQITADNVYPINYELYGGTINAGEVTEYTRGTGATLPTNVTRAGYTFGGWYTDSSFSTARVYKISTTETGEKTYYAKWTPKSGITYKVQHYQQNTSLNGYDLKDTDTKTGTTEATVTATAKTYTGFTENTTYRDRLASSQVLGDGSLILRLYYDRKKYDVTLEVNEGKINKGNITEYVYGVGATLPTDVTKEGYTFAGWYATSYFSGSKVESIGTTTTGEKTYYAKWTAKSGVAYRVEHYQQNTSLNGYNLIDTENKTGTTGQTVTATAKSYTGFTENKTYPDRLASAQVLGDGTLALKFYYDRNKYNVTFNTNKGQINGDYIRQYTYGVGEALPTNVTRDHATFEGWYESSTFSGNRVTNVSTTATGAKTYYAKWTIEKHSVKFKDGTTTQTKQVEHGERAIPPAWSKPGYTLSWDQDISNVTRDMEVNAVWTAKNDTQYIIKHWKQKLGSAAEPKSETNYEEITTDQNNLTGTTDTAVTKQTQQTYIKNYDGFTSPQPYEETIKINGNGSTVINFYYTRNSYNLTLNSGTGIQSVSASGNVNTANASTYLYGETVTVTATLKENTDQYSYAWQNWTGTGIEGSNEQTYTFTMPAGEVNLTANGTETINKYRQIVQVRYQNGDGTYGDYEDKINQEYEYGETVSWSTPATETYKEASIQSYQVTEAKTTQVDIERQTYQVTLHEGTGIQSVSGDGTYRVGQQVTVRAVISNGYEWSNWTGTGIAESGNNPYIFDMPTHAVDLTANATASGGIQYKILHYKQNTSLNGYEEPPEEEIRTGTTGQRVTAVARTYTGFTENQEYDQRKAEGTITEDGNLVLKLYYDRNKYNVTLNPNEGTINGDSITEYAYGVGATLPTDVTKEGYTFAGWYTDQEFSGDRVLEIGTEETEEKTYYAKWDAATNTEYVVKHWKQKLDGNADIENDQNYELADTENKTGTTGEMVTPPVKDYVGFISPEPRTVQILADGSLEVNYYYKRDTEGCYVIVHHYIYDEEAEQEQDRYTNTRLVADETKEGEYGETYTTSMSSEIPENYECIEEHPTGWTGTYETTPIEVSYYYKLLTPSIVDNIRKEVTSATNEAGEVVLTKEDQGVSYRITYNTRVTNYIGKVTIKIVDTLPAKIDLTKSNIEEGDYDENSRTITWTKDVMVDTFEDGDYVEEIIKDITLVYKDQDVTQNLVNRVKGETITYYPDGHVEDKKDQEFESGEAESNVVVKQEYKANFKVVKLWNDNEDINVKRPESVTIHIKVMPNNETITQVLNAQNNWTYEEKGINKYNAEGEKITYIVTESETVPGDLQYYNDAVITNEETQTEEITNYTYTVINTYNNSEQGSFNNTTITKEGPSEITSTEEKANYTINFRSELSNYIGGGRITIVDTLPFAIDKENSILDGGIYDEQAKTITWTEELKQINTETGENQNKESIGELINGPEGNVFIINITKEISLVYKDIDLTKEKMTNTVTGKIELDSSDTVEVGTTGADTDINVEGKVIVKYVDVETEEEIQGEAEEGTYSYEITGAVGEKYETDKKEIPYYVYVKDTENTEGEIGKEETTVIYYYRKMIYNFSMEKTLEGVTLNGQVLNIKDNKLVKVELKSAEVDKAEVIARYNIKVTNDGELAGKVKVLERVPKGFEMVTIPAYWTKNADGTLEAEVELGVGESKDLAVTLKWINDQGNLGSISNKAELIGGSNSANYDDTNKDDDLSEATIIVSIKTGWKVNAMIVVTIIMAMAITGYLIVLIIRKTRKGPHINDIGFLD